MASGEARQFPARAALSGPAGGVLASHRLARALKLDTVATLDIGGTSADAALITAHLPPATGRPIAGLPLDVAAFDVHTIGCGGGSIASIDAGGALRVGPESAGADPGPACYGLGDQPTVTDAHMVMGHMGAETMLGGDFRVDPDLSVRAIERLGKSLGMDLRTTALGILDVADVAMMRALLVITVERAHDPARIPLIAFGGAGGLHAASLMRRLSMPQAIVPRDPGAFSAVGLSLASESHEEVEPVLRTTNEIEANSLRDTAERLGARTRAALPGDGRVRTRVDARVRFAGQGSGLWIPFTWPIDGRFRRAHQRLFGFAPIDAAVELVELRARAERPSRNLPRPARTRQRKRPVTPATRRRPPAGGTSWNVFAREQLAEGSRLRGPCLIEEQTGAIVVPENCVCRVSHDAVLLEWART